MLIPRVLIFVTRGDSVLLLKGAPNKRLWANQYNGVGGHVEPGEDILSAARREFLEETGMTADIWLCGTVVVDTNQSPGIGIHVFTGECPEGELTPSAEGSLDWFAFAEVSRLPVVEDLPVFLNRILKMKRGDTPFHALTFYQDNKMNIIFAE